MPVNICPTEKRAFIIVPRKFKYIIAEILVKKNVLKIPYLIFHKSWENPSFDKKIIDRRDACQMYHPHLNPPPSRGRKFFFAIHAVPAPVFVQHCIVQTHVPYRIFLEVYFYP